MNKATYTHDTISRNIYDLVKKHYPDGIENQKVSDYCLSKVAKLKVFSHTPEGEGKKNFRMKINKFRRGYCE